jgi:hypothetical protein
MDLLILQKSGSTQIITLHDFLRIVPDKILYADSYYLVS